MQHRFRLVRFCSRPVSDLQTGKAADAFFSAFESALGDYGDGPISVFLTDGDAQLRETLVAYHLSEARPNLPKSVRYLLLDPLLLLRFRVPIIPSRGRRCHPSLVYRHFDLDLTCPHLSHAFMRGVTACWLEATRSEQFGGPTTFRGFHAAQLSKTDFKSLARSHLPGRLCDGSPLPEWAAHLVAKQSNILRL